MVNGYLMKRKIRHICFIKMRSFSSNSIRTYDFSYRGEEIIQLLIGKLDFQINCRSHFFTAVRNNTIIGSSMIRRQLKKYIELLNVTYH